jgi:hypothetical protein
MRSLINTNGQQSDTRWLLDQSRRTSDAQIEHQTEWWQDEKDLVFYENASKTRCVRMLLYRRARAVKCRRQEARFRKKSEAFA